MIKSLRLAASALALSAAFGGVAVAQARPFTAKDMASLDRLSDPRVSPDGRFVIYSVRTMDFDANKASMSLWLADLKTRMAPRRLAVSDGGASSARWSPDGKSIYFVSSRAGGTDQVFRADATGETAVQVTSAPFDVGAFKVSPDGKTLVISQAVFPDCDTLDCTQARLDAFARTRQYDDIKSASDYAGCSVPKFDIEGTYCRDARALTWDALYRILGEVQAGTRPVPTGFADIEPDLPPLVWPV